MASELRTKLLKFNPFRERIVTIEIAQQPTDDGAEVPPETVEVKLKQPTAEERNVILAEMKANKDGILQNGAGLTRGLALAVIFCARDPKTNDAVFDMGDLDVLTHLPAGGWADRLAGQVMDLLNEAQAAAKK